MNLTMYSSLPIRPWYNFHPALPTASSPSGTTTTTTRTSTWRWRTRLWRTRLTWAPPPTGSALRRPASGPPGRRGQPGKDAWVESRFSSRLYSRLPLSTLSWELLSNFWSCLVREYYPVFLFLLEYLFLGNVRTWSGGAHLNVGSSHC